MQGIVRCIMEVLFLWIQIDLYGFTVDNRFECPGGDNSLQNPCPPHGEHSKVNSPGRPIFQPENSAAVFSNFRQT